MTQNDVVSTERLAEMLAHDEPVGPLNGRMTVAEARAILAELLSRRSTDGEAAPLVWAIRDLRDGNPHFDEMCVSTDPSDLEEHIEGDEGLEVIPLYRHPPTPTEPVAAPSGPVVTDEMVERALTKWFGNPWMDGVPGDLDGVFDDMRNTLTAALSIEVSL